MKHFALAQKKDVDCPVGMLNAVLYDKFYDGKVIDRVEYGNFNWYSGSGYKNGVQTYMPFPDGLVLIAKDKTYDFDIRGDSGKFYIVSESFVELANSLNCEFDGCNRIEVRGRSGETLTPKKYWVVRFKYYNFADVVDLSASAFGGEPGLIKIKKLTIKKEFSASLFRIKDLSSSNDAVFCSEQFHERVVQLRFKGVDFMDLAITNWPGFRIV
jgi:hypothetical protein